MKQPLVTIIVPVYKVEKYLRRCLDSIATQTYANFEAILVDDGSPDHCGEICDEYAARNTRFRVIHQPNGGVSAARNAGLDDYFRRNEKGYIFFVDPDDYIASNALEILIREAQENRCDIVMGGYSERWPNGRVKNFSSFGNESVNTQKICLAILCDRIPNFAWGRLYADSLWENIRFPEKINMEDLYVMPRIFYKAKHIRMIPDLLYFYSRENEKSILNDLELSSYVHLRYYWFLAWQEHEKVARQYAPEYQQYCSMQALHKALRAGLMNWAVKILSEQEYKTILGYLEEHKNVPVTAQMNIGRQLLLKNNQLNYIIGYIQCWNTLRKEKRQRKRNLRITG